MRLWRRLLEFLGAPTDGTGQHPNTSEKPSPDSSTGNVDADDQARGPLRDDASRDASQDDASQDDAHRTDSTRFRGVVTDVFSIDGVGTVVSARIDAGRVTTGEAVEVEPGSATGTVETIERHHEEVSSAATGDHVGLAIDGIDATDVDAECRLYGVENGHRVD